MNTDFCWLKMQHNQLYNRRCTAIKFCQLTIVLCPKHLRLLSYEKWDSSFHRKWSSGLGENLPWINVFNNKCCTVQRKDQETQPTYTATQPMNVWPKNQTQHVLSLLYTAVKRQRREIGLFQESNRGEKG